jgi:peptidoglycan/LPS O-acetylase OafA/YrhL
VEIQLYIVTAVFYRYLKRLLLWQWGIVLLAALLLNCAGSLIKFNSILDKAIERCFLPYMIWYLIGVFAYVNKDRVLPVLAKYALWLLAVYVVYCFLPTVKIGYYSDAATSILLPFLTIGLSYKLGSIRLKRDLSYSIFLYHWIILNVIIYFNLFTKLHWILCLVLYLAAVFAASYINCLLVEKPMLRLKNRGVRFNILLKRS